MQKLSEVYDLTNKLCDGDLSSINDVIGYLQIAQDIIRDKYPKEATPVTLVVDDDGNISLPADCIAVNRIVDSLDNAVNPKFEWSGAVNVGKEYIGSTLTLYYYMTATPLDPNNLNAQPDVPTLSHLPALAYYGASQITGINEDTQLSQSYLATFYELITLHKPRKAMPQFFQKAW